MKYIIEGQVFFRPEDGTFWMEEKEDEKVILPPIVARLMTLLVDRQGTVLTRDEIMNFVWTVHGLEPSGNSLNQYISNIRRNFQNVGLGDDVIKTIPRIGFIFNAELSVVKVSESEIAQDVDDPGPQPIEHRKKTNGTKTGYSIFALLIAIMAATPIMVKTGVNVLNEYRLEITPVPIGKVNRCEVQTVKMENASRNPKMIPITQKLFNDSNIHCKNHEKAFLFIQSSVFYNKPSRAFISLCGEENKTLTSCKNFSFNNWSE
ncbi:winged helix-turn-helix domain-containing protein [Enterobacter soli]|uniref:winged helix-turn-helix domain-containing protein n=1 Tax=Enterobacter soli TaxID=885040 RepID=UPI00325B9B8C